jgi:hypothetical protein
LLERQPLRAAWFGVKPEAAQLTDRLQTALDAAAGSSLSIGPGVYPITRTLLIPASTEVHGVGPHDVWSPRAGGTQLITSGPGEAKAWQDTGDVVKDTMRPLLVFAGNNIRLRNLGLRTAEPLWDVGVLLPSVKRCKLEDLHVDGHWTLAACLLDATWSERNKRMIALHENRIAPSSMNECTILRCFLSGCWGVLIRGVDLKHHDPMNYRDYEGKGLADREPEWSYGGTSDIEIISCRLEGDLPKAKQPFDGGAYCSDAPLVNGARGGQGHRIIGCNLRTNTRHMVKLGSSNRDSFVSCYFEGGYHLRDDEGRWTEIPSEMTNDADRTGRVTFMDCRFTTVDTKKSWDFKNTKTWPE